MGLVMRSVYTANFQKDEGAEESRNARIIRDLWVEWKCANQYDKCWLVVETGLRLQAVLKGVEAPGQLDDDEEDSPRPSFRFIEMQYEPPEWFKKKHLGMGTIENYFDNRTGMTEKNKQRIANFVKLKAEEVRVLIKRTVRG